MKFSACLLCCSLLPLVVLATGMRRTQSLGFRMQRWGRCICWHRNSFGRCLRPVRPWAPGRPPSLYCVSCQPRQPFASYGRFTTSGCRCSCHWCNNIRRRRTPPLPPMDVDDSPTSEDAYYYCDEYDDDDYYFFSPTTTTTTTTETNFGSEHGEPTCSRLLRTLALGICGFDFRFAIYIFYLRILLCCFRCLMCALWWGTLVVLFVIRGFLFSIWVRLLRRGNWFREWIFHCTLRFVSKPSNCPHTNNNNT
jgi:hypothetical protein